MFHVYMLRCRDGTLYTGYARDLKKRLETHSRGKGSKYVKSRRPFKLVYSEKLETKSQAMKRENEIKSLNRHEKCRLAGKHLHGMNPVPAPV